mmetsp:Transcript_14235/g.24211  ORF Transcript_14235/g.24211 Transcript_14235/m.24211 type:complete len:522 (-) Transcript_14235:432-1997(-)
MKNSDKDKVIEMNDINLGIGYPGTGTGYEKEEEGRGAGFAGQTNFGVSKEFAEQVRQRSRENRNEQNDELANVGGSTQFEKVTCFQPFWVGFRKLLYGMGALLAVLNISLDLIYFFQTPYQKKTVYQLTIIFIGLRILVSLGLPQFYYHTKVRNYRPQLGKFQDHKDEEVRNEIIQLETLGANLYGGLHLLYFTGSFRLLEVRDFRTEIWRGYLIEVILSTLPMLFCQIFNNYEADMESYSPIQSLTLMAKFAFIFYSFFELIFMAWESSVFKRKQKEKVPGFEKATDEEKRILYGKRIFWIGIVFITIFLAIVLFGLSLGSYRKCAAGQSIEFAVCKDCDIDNCEDCQGNYKQCNSCKEGFYLGSNGKCLDCDFEPYVECKKCASYDKDESTVCEECAEGYRLNNGKCQECDESGLCNECTSSKCLECKPGNRLVDGVCHPCSESLTHCKTCSSKDKCEECDYYIAELGPDKKCNECKAQNNWFMNQMKGSCECKEFVNVLDQNKCQECQELIPGCRECE